MPQILTNKHNLPDTLVNAIKVDKHVTKGDISVTTLIDAPQIRMLKMNNTYEVDCVDNLYALMGTALHHILERGSIPSVKKEAFKLTAETIFQEAAKLDGSNDHKANQLRAAAKYIIDLIPVFFPEIGNRYIFEMTLQFNADGMVVSGTFDLYDTIEEKLWDYKLCSTMMYMQPESRKKWEQQLNIYATMLNEKGYNVKSISIVAFFRNWDAYSGMRNKNYPTQHIMQIPIPVWGYDKGVAFIQQRVSLHIRAMNGENIPCTGEDRWANAGLWNVYNVKAKKSIRKFPTEIQAKTFIAENEHIYASLEVQYREGESKRCAEYCPVVNICPQRKKELELIELYKKQD